MRPYSLLLFLTALSAGAAQQPQQAQHALTAQIASLRGMEADSCPVSFGAELDSRLIVRTVGDPHKDLNAPLLKLTFRGRNTPKILGASVTVHGLSSSRLYLPVAQSSDESRTQAFEFNRAPGSASLADTEVWVSKMAIVRWAEVTEIRYADGSAWHPSSDALCRAVPSRFRLVDAIAQ